MKYLIKLSFVLLFLAIFSCWKKEVVVASFEFPVIIENYINYDKLELVSKRGMQDGNHMVNYFGEMTDTLRIDPIIMPSFDIPLPPGLDSSAKETNLKKGKFDDYYINWAFSDRAYSFRTDSFEISIHIDTTRIIYNFEGEAYPVIIKNNSLDTIVIGYGDYIPIITEAKNEEGEWKPIEKRFQYFCGVGVHTLILPPNEIVVTTELKYSGDFKTTLRIRYGDNYSNEFNGEINLSQFEN